MTLGERIKQARKNKGLTQEELADLLNITARGLQNYERNTRQPRIEMLNKIAKILRVPLESLVLDNFIPNDKLINLVDLNLQGITPSDELLKVKEENKEFEMAVLECLCNPIEENKLHAIEEFWDKVQSSLSYLQITLGIKADEVMENYNLHLEKIKNRPR